jgi:SAM-dependent methyltransferase
MDETLRAQRSLSFGGVAEVYDRARPGYPEDAVRWLIGPTPGRVLELGAGTGKLSAVMLGLGHQVVAAEPSLPMLRYLEVAAPKAHRLQGGAEAIGLSSSSVDAVIAAQAFHWFDPAKALPEIARVLRPGGILALVWNYRDETVPWVRRLSELIGSEPGPDAEVTPVVESDLFGEVEHRKFRFWQPIDRDLLIGLVQSRSYIVALGETERREILDRVGALYDSYGRGKDGMLLPYVTHCYRTRVTDVGNFRRDLDGPDDGLLIDFH